MRVFEEYEWPGNIRELENIIRRIIILGEEEKILQDLVNKKLEDGVRPGAFKDFSPNGLGGSNLFDLREVGRRAGEEVERETIHNTLQRDPLESKGGGQIAPCELQGTPI